ncbi:MAG: ubiquinone/menaquinone biosynthesis methyltransferase [bacterium]|nr:ubiquinone/menaquinone biosynthesis methyltransferase [bacterium]
MNQNNPTNSPLPQGPNLPKHSDLPQGPAKRVAVRAMFDAIAPRYDLLNRMLTFGMDRRWRRKAVRTLHLPKGAQVVDIACGTGDFCQDLEAAGLQAVGIDLSAGMLASAQQRHQAGKLKAPLVLADALCLPLHSRSADGITCGFALRNVVALDALFAELARVLRPGGRASLLEVAEPSNRLLRAGHQLYFAKAVPKIGGWLSDSAAYQYLPKSMAYLPPTAELLSMLKAQGFSKVTHQQLSGGITQLITATRTTPTPSTEDLLKREQGAVEIYL